MKPILVTILALASMNALATEPTIDCNATFGDSKAPVHMEYDLDESGYESLMAFATNPASASSSIWAEVDAHPQSFDRIRVVLHQQVLTDKTFNIVDAGKTYTAPQVDEAEQVGEMRLGTPATLSVAGANVVVDCKARQAR